MVSLGSPSTPFRNSSQAASQGSPKGVMDFIDQQAEGPRTSRLQETSRAIDSSSIQALEALTFSQYPAPPIIRLKPRHDPNRSLWDVDPNASQLPRYQATATLSTRQTDFVGSHFTSQRLLELRAGEIPTSLLLPLDF